LKEEALDRTMWRALFGRGFGPVVRQTAERMNECLLYILHIRPSGSLRLGMNSVRVRRSVGEMWMTFRPIQRFLNKMTSTQERLHVFRCTHHTTLLATY
jgi:hypothetical protein